jgi:hypothetical protein
MSSQADTSRKEIGMEQNHKLSPEVSPTPAEHPQLRRLCNRVRAIRQEARAPKRDFDLDWQLGRLLEELEVLAGVVPHAPQEKEKDEERFVARRRGVLVRTTGTTAKISNG